MKTQESVFMRYMRKRLAHTIAKRGEGNALEMLYRGGYILAGNPEFCRDH